MIYIVVRQKIVYKFNFIVNIVREKILLVILLNDSNLQNCMFIEIFLLKEEYIGEKVWGFFSFDYLIFFKRFN